MWALLNFRIISHKKNYPCRVHYTVYKRGITLSRRSAKDGDQCAMLDPDINNTKYLSSEHFQRYISHNR